MTDHSPAIVLVCLVLLSGMAFLGFRDLQTESLNIQMDYAESEWEQAVEDRKEKRERWCLQYAVAYANSLDYLTFDPGEAMGVYDNCLAP